ncbi:FAD-dependent oxidoreductase [Clostridium sp. MCC353]|uniref:NAD(P)/FAD-dependent oxidoreductase n=1 Tax=Clostridium sp. MCC353 TaxID=2592646 RepID=UPI001C0294B8|nr:NAD(P)/FAD-dependent oxidoreductase [Clostridium sp. MCC353]MBT9775706.1 FAD-dependent oxidoreductase [Clostridium sp. MCC353]
MDQLYDVLIVGAGVVGSAIAREMARYKLKIGVLEKNLDVCYETSGRNSAVVHGGFAYDTGTLKAKLCVEGNRMMGELAEELDFPFLRCGKVLVGNTKEDMETLKRTMVQGEKNGASGLELVDKEQLHQLVPAVVGEFAMFSRNSGIMDPFHFTVALAENAHENGVDYYFDNEVTGISRDQDGNYRIETVQDVYRTRWVVNAAGLGCKKISDMLGITGYRVIGSKGDYIILDKRLGELLPMPVYPVPSNTYMGIHVTNTIDGNVTVGPNADMVEDFTYYGVPQKNMDYLAESASKLWPHIRKADQIRNYSGILPKWVDENGVIQDFKIEIKDETAPNAINLVGIESPGLTAAVPIARYAIGLMKEREHLEENENFNPRRKGIVRFEGLPKEEQAKLIRENPDYGEVICRCEKVTKAEVLQAIHNPLGVSTMVGIKYRTRSMMGRCQGGYCQMRIEQMIEEELGKKETDIVYARQGSWVLNGKVREE